MEDNVSTIAERKFLQILWCGGIILLLAGCTVAEIPSIGGKVMNADTGMPVAGAMIVVTYSGRTKVREKWFHPLTGMKSSRCIRMVAMSDDGGTFSTPVQHVVGYFGAPEVHLNAYHKSLRYKISGAHHDFESTDSFVIKMWSELSAERYGLSSGFEVAYARVENPRAFRERQRDRHNYLDMWLGAAGITDNCEYEPNRKEIDKFLIDLFREWRDTAPKDAGRKRALMACDALRSFQLSDVSLAEEFIQLKESSLKSLCTKSPE